MRVRHIVRGQKVEPATIRLSKELRRGMTREERFLWNHLRGKRLDGIHFRRQQIVSGFVVDFYCHSAGLVVELDGPVHEKQKEHDRNRDRILMAKGLRILRFTNDELGRNPLEVLKKIKENARPNPQPLP